MTDGVASCAQAMEASQHQLETAAENMANLETDGFRSELGRAGGRNGAALPLRATGRAFDLAVTGRASLHVVSGGGSMAIRAGSFHRDDTGRLIDTHGRALLGADGKPVHVPEGVQINSDGTFVANHATVARIALGGGAELRSGFVEGSDVNSIAEMIEVLDAQRSFETASKALTSIDTARQKASNDVGKIQ